MLGNHEFYGHGFERLVAEAREVAADSNVHVLENDAIHIGGLRVLGCTLWTDFRALGEATRPIAMRETQRALNDYFLIRRPDGQLIEAYDTERRCAQSHAWLQHEIAADNRPTLVVTHMAPTLKTLHPRHATSILNAAFHNQFDGLIRAPVRAWIHGHTHHSCAVEVNGIPVVTNQRGYPKEGVSFSWDYMIEVSPHG